MNQVKYEEIIDNFKNQVDIWKKNIDKLSKQKSNLQIELADINESMLNLDVDVIVDKAHKNEQYEYKKNWVVEQS